MKKPIQPTPYGVKTAYADAEHMRLTLPPPEERVNPPQTTRRKGPDPDDPWATNTFGVIPTRQERQRIPWETLFTEKEIQALALALTYDARHQGCQGWRIDHSSTLICICGEPLFRLEAVA